MKLTWCLPIPLNAVWPTCSQSLSDVANVHICDPHCYNCEGQHQSADLIRPIRCQANAQSGRSPYKRRQRRLRARIYPALKFHGGLQRNWPECATKNRNYPLRGNRPSTCSRHLNQPTKTEYQQADNLSYGKISASKARRPSLQPRKSRRQEQAQERRGQHRSVVSAQHAQHRPPTHASRLHDPHQRRHLPHPHHSLTTPGIPPLALQKKTEQMQVEPPTHSTTPTPIST